MMKGNFDIDYIRSLLDRYYRAETSPDEETILESFFSEVRFDDLPIDLASSKKLFDITKQLHPTIEDSEVPDRLIDKLNCIVEKPMLISEGRRLKNFHNILRYFGFASAACVALAIIMVFMRPSEKVTPAEKGYTAEVISGKSDEPDIPILIEPVEDNGIATEIEPRANRNNPLAEAQSTIDEDRFIEIRDPAEAQRIMLEIGKLLAQNASEVNNAMCDISNSLENYKEISKSILQ